MKKDKTKKKQKKDRSRLRGITMLVIAMICLILIGSSVVMLSQYSGMIENEASIIGLRKTTEAAELFRTAMIAYEEKAALMGKITTSTGYEDRDDFISHLQRLGADERFSDTMFVRFFNGANEYTAFGEEFNSALESKSVLKLRELRRLACAGVVSDRQFSISAVAYCVPLENFQYADMLVVYYPITYLINYSQELNELDVSDSRITAICSAEGEVVSILGENDLEIAQHNNMYESLRGIINDKNIIDSIQLRVANGTSGSYTTRVSNESHVVAVSSINEYGSAPFSVISVYRSDIVNSVGYTTITMVLGEMILFFAILIFIIVYLLIGRYRREKKLAAIADTDSLLGVSTRAKFVRDSEAILQRNKATLFAVVALDIRHYSYLEEQLGDEAVEKLLMYLKMIYTRVLTIDETLGYLGKDRFVMLLHYREIDTVAQRVSSVSSLAAAYGNQFGRKFTVELTGGIYKLDSKVTDSVTKMVDLAVDAENANRFPYDFGLFRYYNELFHESEAQNEYIELHMESALKNKDFKLFYQPKYNIAGDCPDGCEALVRWYNPELNDYMQPGVFLPLFEANRFIVKLDKYVYEQACIHYAEARSNGVSVYPISVNLSHITIAEKDIVKYLLTVRQDHGIGDGVITLEFTESFAYEDFDMLRDVISDLRKNGFKCCIDDFGNGNSSFSILKELPMDEIKLDRLFLMKSFSTERDMKILASAIALARSLNMKVTQKGVETIDQLDLLRKLGCHSIQGYYYSKPLALIDYLDFIDHENKKQKAFSE